MSFSTNSTFVSKYTILDKIGEGSFSDVLKCEEKATGRYYAAKRLKKVFKNVYEVVNCAEIIAMNKLTRHPNIVYMVEFHYDPKFGKVIFIFELMDMSMYDFMKLKKRKIPEPKVRSYLYQILKGVDHLHSHGLFHRDIKPENILVKLRNSFYDPVYQFQGELIKLADLGSIRGIYSKPPYTEYISTRWYRSPECLLTVGYYGPKMDIWAAGCVFYEMLTLKPLFPGQDEIDQLAKIHEVLGTPNDRILNKLKKRSRNFSNFPKQTGVGLKSIAIKVGEDALSVLQQMIHYDPDVRANVRRLLEHRFFRTLREEDIYYKYKHSTKDYLTKALNTNKGDYYMMPVYNYLPHKRNKYKTSRSSSRSNKRTYSNPPTSRTTIDLINYRPSSKVQNHNLRPTGRLPLVGEKQMKSWGINPDILNPKEGKNKYSHDYIRHLSNVKPLLQHRSKHKIYNKEQNLSKTTSYLPQITNYHNIEVTKGKQFQSKSFILPRNSISPELKIKTVNVPPNDTEQSNKMKTHEKLKK